MVFKVGSNTVIDSSGIFKSGTANGSAATPTGFQNSGGNDLGNLTRFTTYTDDKATNCRGYLASGNCSGNSYYDPPNGNWWTWGIGQNCVCGNGGFDGAGGVTNCTYNAISVSYVYDGYYELYNRIRGSEQHRNYSNCNCVTGPASYGNNTNCNCNCACACACDCTCACACDCACACNC